MEDTLQDITKEFETVGNENLVAKKRMTDEIVCLMEERRKNDEVTKFQKQIRHKICIAKEEWVKRYKFSRKNMTVIMCVKK